MLDVVQEVVAVDVVGETQGDEVFPFLVGAEAVTDDDVFAATAIEFPDEGTANESGSTGDEDATFRVLHALRW